MNKKIEEMIQAFANYNIDNWDIRLIDFDIAHNSAVNSTTLCTPFNVNYVKHPRTDSWVQNPNLNSSLKPKLNSSNKHFFRIVIIVEKKIWCTL